MTHPDCAALILAAGKGTRMRSEKPKVLAPILGSPMLAYILRALSPLFGERIFIVAGYGAESVTAAFPDARFIMQAEQLGTGHAARTALPEVKNFEYVLVVNGDCPALTTKDAADFLERARGCDIAFASIELENPGAYGRVMRKEGILSAIVEARELDDAAKAPAEVNTGIYLFRTAALEALLPQLSPSQRSGEYYITDLVALGLARNMDVRAIFCGSDENLLGVNSPAELIEAEEAMQRRVNQALLEQGVVLRASQAARISPFAQIAAGADISGPCEIFGESVIEKGARVEAFTSIRDSRIARNAIIRSFSHLEKAEVGGNAVIGPYARLRPGSEISEGARVGNFVELKQTRLGEGAKASHLSYLGDSFIGAGANIGAGTITCNYDGARKHQTVIGDGAFIGSNSSLVAPVFIGPWALVGAGSVITGDVPENSLALGRSRQTNLPQRGMKKDDE